MRRKMSFLTLAIIFCLSSIPVFAQDQQVPLKINRISENIIIYTEDSMTNNIAVINSQQGLVIIDTSGCPTTAKAVRTLAEKEFGKKHFAYVINTHHHWDHAWGNQAFPEALIVGYQGCKAGIEADKVRLPEIVASRRNRSVKLRMELEELEYGSEEYNKKAAQVKIAEREVKDYTSGFQLLAPQISFNDKMEIDLGDLTLQLFYFGRAHSGNDIFILIPEEKVLFTGDVFLDQNWLPLFCGMRTLDIDKWIQVLATLLDGKIEIETVVPGHKALWDKNKLDLWRTYIVDLRKAVQEAKASNTPFDAFLESYPLGEKYLYLEREGHSQERIKKFHNENIKSFWQNISVPE